MRKIIKSSDTEEANTFRLHYFPNIPLGANGGSGASPEGAQTPEAAGRGWPELSSSPQQRAEGKEEARRKEIEQQAYAAGFAKGEAEGRQAAQAQAAPLLQVLAATLGELDGIRRKVKRQLEQEAVELALQVVRKIVRHELAVSGETILQVVTEAMGHMDDPGRIVIRLNPEDLKRIREADRRLAPVFEKFDSIQFEEDPGIACGGCYIQTEFGDIDARIQEQFRVVEEALRAETLLPTLER